MTQSIDEKFGNLLLIGFEGSTLTHNSPIIQDIRNHKLGGVILFDKLLAKKRKHNNIVSPAQVKELTTRLKDTADDLLISVDQEGGMVSRFKVEQGFPITPTPFQLASDPSLTKTEKAANQTARMLSELGINFNLAPVTDLNVYPHNPIIGKYERSFSNSAEIVGRHAATWIKAHDKHGILSCLKHFPGHGSSKTDSHKGFVDISETWHEKELVPYKLLQEKKLINAVMTGHLFNSNLDTVYPATLSRKTISGLLRNNIGYNGPLLSDDMQMAAISQHYGLEDACCQALTAGIDLLVIGNNLRYDPDLARKLINSFKRALDNGTLSESRVKEAWDRVQQLKNKIKQSGEQYDQ